MNILIACEESQEVCKAFREKGHKVFSCDLQECSGGHPEWHIKGDVLKVINGNCIFETQDGHLNSQPEQWDMIIAHPPCTYLTVTGNRWFNFKHYGDAAKERYNERCKAIVFFMQIAKANCKKICIENPVGIMSTVWTKPNQIIQPYMFGEPFEKKTCLWLNGLPKLKPTNIIKPPKRIKFESGRSMPAWYADSWELPKEERAKIRSKTFTGIAKAMAEQWG